MKYDKPKEKEEIIRVFMVFLLMRGFNSLTEFCKQYELDYQQTDRKLKKGNIDHDYIVSLIKLVDKNFSLINFNRKFQILKEQR